MSINVIIAFSFLKNFLLKFKSDDNKSLIKIICRVVIVQFKNLFNEIIDERFEIAVTLILRERMTFDFNNSIVLNFFFSF